MTSNKPQRPKVNLCSIGTASTDYCAVCPVERTSQVFKQGIEATKTPWKPKMKEGKINIIKPVYSPTARFWEFSFMSQPAIS